MESSLLIILLGSRLFRYLIRTRLENDRWTMPRLIQVQSVYTVLYCTNQGLLNVIITCRRRTVLLLFAITLDLTLLCLIPFVQLFHRRLIIHRKSIPRGLARPVTQQSTQLTYFTPRTRPQPKASSKQCLHRPQLPLHHNQDCTKSPRTSQQTWQAPLLSRPMPSLRRQKTLCLVSWLPFVKTQIPKR